MGFLELIRKRSVRNVPDNLVWFGLGVWAEENRMNAQDLLPALLSKIPVEVNTEHYNF